jgi:hypothetical protein
MILQKSAHISINLYYIIKQVGVYPLRVGVTRTSLTYTKIVILFHINNFQCHFISVKTGFEPVSPSVKIRDIPISPPNYKN